uniref:Glycosyltransferase family 92 protein n=1 Tax=Rhabditophanes sp. KR3021 TaxID=114890 RepID=A0AC35UD54_9BILA
MSELERHVSSNTVPAPLKRNFYVRSGFRVSDNEIRLSVVTYSRNKETLYWLRDGLAVGRVELVCQGNKCPSDYSRRCALVGYIGIIKSDKPEQLTNTIEITNSFDNNTVSIDLIDRRKPQQLVYGHKLGVCVQPMFLYYNYLELISFIEKWIVAGATKFYFLQESMTSNILKVINYYKNNVAGISVQVIDWPSLPKLTDYHDPNLYIYRLERNLAIMECMYHARYQTKYVAQVHLNQFIISQNHETLLTYLESKSTSHSIASFSFRSVNAILTSKWNSVEDMAKVKFENHFKVKHTRSFERPIYSKLIFRPDYVS